MGRLDAAAPAISMEVLAIAMVRKVGWVTLCVMIVTGRGVAPACKPATERGVGGSRAGAVIVVLTLGGGHS